ncbi:MAG: DHH family phosphoesterase [Bifidobacteriaceae bacterium]|nr:DHH family phosphoesterase [Bifidobacteriaceae bacterium]
MNSLLQLFFQRRGYTAEFLQDIENDEHDDLKSIHELCDALHVIHTERKRIVILPDFDTDGIMSGVLGFAGMCELGFNVSLYRPNPNDGYGFTPDTIDIICKQYPDTQAIITCDNGVTCDEGVEYAQQHGIKMFVTDHHQQQNDPVADIVVDPCRLDETYKNKSICGAFVLWQVLHTYANKYADSLAQENIQRLRVFAGIATIGDLMSLRYENRSLVREAYQTCQQLISTPSQYLSSIHCHSSQYKTAFTGLLAMLQTFERNGKLRDIEDINAEFFGFVISPTLNSVKRMDQITDIAFAVFFMQPQDNNAQQLYQLNTQRKTKVANTLTQIQHSEQPYAPYIYISPASPSIAGLLATQFMSKTQYPTLVLSKFGNGELRGSGRSPHWFNSIEEINNAGFYAAGHQGAYGVRLQSEEELQPLYEFLKKRVTKELADNPDINKPKPADICISTQEQVGDCNIDMNLFVDFLHELANYEPFGVDFEKPEIELRFNCDDAQWVAIGQQQQHIRCILPQKFVMLAWNSAEHLQEWSNAKAIAARGHLSLNTFGGVESAQFICESVQVLQS